MSTNDQQSADGSQAAGVPPGPRVATFVEDGHVAPNKVGADGKDTSSILITPPATPEDQPVAGVQPAAPGPRVATFVEGGRVEPNEVGADGKPITSILKTSPDADEKSFCCKVFGCCQS